jgi:hypothetical protein
VTELWIAVVSGVIAGLITAAPNAWVAWWVNRKLDARQGSAEAGAGAAETSDDSPSHQTFVYIDQRIQQNIRVTKTPDESQSNGTEWIAGVGLVLLAMVLSQHQQVVTGGLIGLSIGTTVATVLTVRRNRTYRGELGGNGILAVCEAVVGAVVPLVVVLLLDALRFRGRSYWQYGRDSVAPVVPTDQHPDAFTVISSFLADAVSSVVVTVRDGGPQAVAFLLFACAALVAAALAVASSARMRLAWYVDLAENTDFARRVASRFDRLSARALLTSVFVIIILLAMPVAGSLWLDHTTLTPALPIPATTGP